MRRAAISLALGSLAAIVAGCSLFHEDFPGRCTSGTDCWKGIETCDLATHECVPIPDAALLPDSGPDAAADAATDGGPDAATDGGADAAPDARPIDAGVPDAT